MMFITEFEIETFYLIKEIPLITFKIKKGKFNINKKNEFPVTKLSVTLLKYKTLNLP